MRNLMTIVGVGSRKSGHSAKTDRDYDFTPISVQFETTTMNGVRAETCLVSQSVLEGFSPSPGDVVDAVYHWNNGKLIIDGFI